MLDKQFGGTIYLITNVLHPRCVVEPAKEVPGVSVAERAMPLAEDVCQISPHVDLDYFEGFSEQVAEHDVEVVRAGNIIERDIWKKYVPLLFKCQAITAEPIVVDVCEKTFGGGHIGNE